MSQLHREWKEHASPVGVILARANIALLRSDATGAASLYQEVRNEYLYSLMYFEYPHHLLGRLARTAGDLDLALEHLEKAHRFLDEGGWKPP